MIRHAQRATLLVALSLLTGCVSQGLIGPLPTVSDKDNAAEIIVIRESRVLGSMQTLPVTLDGVRIYGLGSGEHAVMAVNPGDHIVGTQYPVTIPPSWEDVTSWSGLSRDGATTSGSI
jgi:hypothetical protein